MTTAHCPKCDELVSVPSDASPRAIVQCPLCQEDFRLAEALDQLPPSLVVLEDPGVATDAGPDLPAAPAGSIPSDTSVDNPQLAETPADETAAMFAGFATADAGPANHVAIDPSLAESTAPDFEFEANSAPAETAPRATPARSIRAERPQRRKRSAAREVIQIVAGGVVGLTIAQLILWWLPGKWKRDPFDLGPQVSRVASFVVPEQFHDKSLATSNDVPQPESGLPAVDAELPSFQFAESALGGKASDDAGSSRASMQSTEQDSQSPRPGPNKRGPGRATPKRGGDAAPATNDEPTDEPQPSRKTSATNAADAAQPDGGIFGATAEVDVPALEINPFPLIDDAARPAASESPAATGTPASESALRDLETLPPSEPAQPASEPVVEPTTEAENDVNEFLGVRNAPTFTATQLSDKFSEALSANLELDTTNSPAGKLLIEFYVAFAELGEVMTFVDQEEAAVVEQIAEIGDLLQEIGRQPDKLDVIDKVTPKWLEYHRNNGVIVHGTVKSIRSLGPYYATQLILPNKDLLTVVASSNPEQHYQPDSKVLLLGTILEEPRKNLGQYRGTLPLVVLDGFHVALAAE